jgi:hypothetical protein
MKLSAILLTNVVFATVALAAPGSIARRHASRARNSNPLLTVSSITSETLLNASHVQYSSNWAGAIITAPPAGQTFNAISGSFTVPTPKAPSSGSGSWSSSAWVGIDGDTYQNAILQSGIDFTVTSSGGRTSTSFDAWYEWYPNYAIDFTGFEVSAGDVISISITSSSSSKGKIVMENMTTGKSVTQSVSAPSSSSHLGGQNAEWIVEDFDEGGSQVAFANFGTVTFTDCVAKTSSETIGVSGATIIDIKTSSGSILTDASIPSSSEVQVVYE